MQARPRSQKLRDAFAQNQLSIPTDYRLPNCDFETLSQDRSRPTYRSTAGVRLIDVFAAKKPARVAEVIRPAFEHRGKSTSTTERSQGVLPATPVSISRFLSRSSLRVFVNPAARALPVSSGMRTVGVTLRR